MPTTCRAMEGESDIRLFGGTRHMDLIMYVLYSNDQRFVQVMPTAH